MKLKRYLEFINEKFSEYNKKGIIDIWKLNNEDIGKSILFLLLLPV
jgi:hypothetical protein